MGSQSSNPRLADYEAWWTSEKDRYVIVLLQFPDGTLYHDFYTRDGVYATLPDDTLHLQVVEKMLAAGVEVLDADTWSERGRSLYQHEHLCTKAKRAFVLVTSKDGVPGPGAEIRTLHGEIYSVAAEIKNQVVSRMLDAGVRTVDAESLTDVLTELRQGQAALEAQESRSYRSCLSNGKIPRAWLRHRIDLTELEGAETPSPVEEHSTDAVLDHFTGRLNARQIQATYPDFMARRQPGDELWWFKNPQRCWRALAGRAGYCLIRPHHPIVDFVVAVLS